MLWYCDRGLENRGVYNYRNTYNKDTLTNKPKANESLVIKEEDYFDDDGTHWVAIYSDPKTRDVEHFDSLGMRPSEAVYRYIQTTGKGIVNNSSILQDINSVLCGYYCLYFIVHRWQGRSMQDILLDFTQMPSLKNERRVGCFM